MKTLLVTISLALAGMGSAQAQVFGPSVGNGALVGAIAGSLIGGHNGDRWAEGALIGGVAGAVIGAALTPERVYQSPPPVYHQTSASYGQQVYGQSPPVVQHVPTVSNAPCVPAAPMVREQVPTQVVQAPPQIVYVESAPRVVYVPAPRVIYAAPPPYVGFGFRDYPGSRHYGHSSPRHRGSHGHHR